MPEFFAAPTIVLMLGMVLTRAMLVTGMAPRAYFRPVREQEENP